MKDVLHRVRIAGAGSFLPNEPVPNDRIDDVLGPIDGAPERVQTFMRTVGRRMLEHSGVEKRHFAIDAETNQLTHTIASLGEGAARRALEMSGHAPEDVEFLVISSPTFDAGTPPTSALLQQRLGIERCAEMEIHSNCSGIGKSMQVAYDAMRLGRYRTALVVYSQLSSVYLRSCYFNQPIMTKTQAALRYILADGAGAVVLESDPDAGPGDLRGEVLGTHIESIGGKRDPAMTCGGGVQDIMSGKNPIEAMYHLGLHHLDQDFSAVNKLAGPLLFEGLLRMLAKLECDSASIDHYVLSIPTKQLYDENATFIERLGVSDQNVRFRSNHCGYCGGATLLIHLDEMVRSGELQRGQTAAVYSVESSKWMSAGFVVRW